jgi:hypothetical protein
MLSIIKKLLVHFDVLSVGAGTLLFAVNTITAAICIDVLEKFCFP